MNASTLERRAFFATLLICAALLAAPWRGHVDDQDAQLYLLVARTMASAHAWFDLSALPGFYARFREHTPFGFWPSIAAIRLFGERAVNPLNALFTLAAILVVGRIARRLGGPWAAIAAMLLLGTCEAIWQYGGRPLLEPLLFLFATAAAGAALEDRWILAAVLGAVAALIKGPFGLLPLGCVALAKLPDRRGLLAAILAVIPLALFIWIDPGGGWRSIYLRERLLGLTSGRAANGIVLWWFPLAVTAHRFWPGLPFLALGALWAVRERRLRPLALACVLLLAALCVPERKWGNHTYVAFPLFAVLAGVTAGALLEKLNASYVANALVAGSLAVCIASASGLVARVLPPPCPFSTGLAPALAAIKPGAHILVVAEPVDTAAVVELAAERRLVPWPLRSLPAASPVGTAVVHDGISIPRSWTRVARAGGWTLVYSTGLTTRASPCPASPCAG